MACLSTSLGDLNAFKQPCHSQRNGWAGSGLGIVTAGTVVTTVEPGVESVFDTVVLVDVDETPWRQRIST